MSYHSQYKQDQFLNENVFKGMTGGFFLEMGADDGIAGSNTLFFEQELGWSGICVEPRKEAYTKLVKNRKCLTANVGIALENKEKDFLEIKGYGEQTSGIRDYMDERHIERVRKELAEKGGSAEVVTVSCITLNDLFKQFKIARIDYFSLDTEGGEFELLRSIDYSKIKIRCISVENNYHEPHIEKFLKTKGYQKLTTLGIDEIYILKNDILNTYKEPLMEKIKRAEKPAKKLLRSTLGNTVYDAIKKMVLTGTKKTLKKALPKKVTGIYSNIAGKLRYKKFLAKFPGLKIGNNVRIAENCSLGKGIKMGNDIYLRGVDIGDYTYFSSKISANSATIGKYCSIGPDVKIGIGLHPAKTFVSTHPAFFSSRGQSTLVFADKNYFEELARITIGNDVWIGSNVIIKDGVAIGDGAIVGVGAVVVKDVEPYSIVGGVPAKLIRYRFEPEEIDFLMKLRWWNKPVSWLQNNWKDFLDIKQFMKKHKNNIY